MTIADLRRLLGDLETSDGFDSHTRVFIDDGVRGLQEPVLSTREKLMDGAHVVIIEAAKDTASEVS